MINSINFIDGLDGLSSGVALIAAVTLGIISVTGVATEPVGGPGLLDPGRGAPGVPALELPPRLDLHRHQRGDVPRLHAGAPLDPGQRQGGGGAPGAGRADHRHLLHHRAPGLAAAARRSRRTGATSTTASWTWASPTPRRCCSSTRSASASGSSRSSCRGAGQLYAFLGAFLVFGLVILLLDRVVEDRSSERGRERRTLGRSPDRRLGALR